MSIATSLQFTEKYNLQGYWKLMISESEDMGLKHFRWIYLFFLCV